MYLKNKNLSSNESDNTLATGNGKLIGTVKSTLGDLDNERSVGESQ